MTEYALHVESGPRRRKTMVHVLDLLGCIAQGATTDEALAATPAAIRAYLRFLQRHGDAFDLEEPFTPRIAAHVMEGSWIGQGDPAAGFPPDFAPLTLDDLARYRRRLAWLHSDLVDRVRGLTPAEMLAQPPSGRPVYGILDHVAGAYSAYFLSPVTRPAGMAQAVRFVADGPATVTAALSHLWQLGDERLAALTDAERRELVPHGERTWSARRALRRMLEHAREHLVEVETRLGVEA